MDSHIYDEPDIAESELHVFINPIRETQTSSRSLWDAIEQSTQTIDESMGPDIRHSMAIRAVLARIRAGETDLYDSFNPADKFILTMYMSTDTRPGPEVSEL